MKRTTTSQTTALVIGSLIGASDIRNETESMFSQFDECAVVKRSYSRAIFCSFRPTQSHSFSGRKLLTFYRKACENRVNIEGAELAPNQIPASAPNRTCAYRVLLFGLS